MLKGFVVECVQGEVYILRSDVLFKKRGRVFRKKGREERILWYRYSYTVLKR